jgi:hypothetical protein
MTALGVHEEKAASVVPKIFSTRAPLVYLLHYVKAKRNT